MNKLLFIFLALTTSIFAQKNVNNYKYVIVPKKFDFVKKDRSYQTSRLTKFLFKKYGFTAVLSDEKLPEDLAKNRCLALTADIENKSSMFLTKIKVKLLDCFNEVIYTSSEGRSKQKDYKKAYHESIRSAFKSIEALKYAFNPLKTDSEEHKELLLREPITTKLSEGKDVNVIEIESLYAQPIPNGFQLVNTKPEVVFNILKSEKKDVFILKLKNGILYKNNDVWIAEYYDGSEKILEKFFIKF